MYRISMLDSKLIECQLQSKLQFGAAERARNSASTVGWQLLVIFESANRWYFDLALQCSLNISITSKVFICINL